MVLSGSHSFSMFLSASCGSHRFSLFSVVLIGFQWFS